MKACKNCHMITDQEKCPNCSGELSKEWQGYCIILDYTRSEIAKKLQITNNGRYALRIR
ncbi:MAG: transcription elongation factor subunit Spt4 [Thermoplasmata archaeon]